MKLVGETLKKNKHHMQQLKNKHSILILDDILTRTPIAELLVLILLLLGAAVLSAGLDFAAFGVVPCSEDFDGFPSPSLILGGFILRCILFGDVPATVNTSFIVTMDGTTAAGTMPPDPETETARAAAAAASLAAAEAAIAAAVLPFGRPRVGAGVVGLCNCFKLDTSLLKSAIAVSFVCLAISFFSKFWEK